MMSFYRNFLTCVCAIGLVAVAAPASAQLSDFNEDFEELMLASPGGNTTLNNWVTFTNIFDSGGGYLFGYAEPFFPPNDSDAGAFANVEDGQGGPAQGDQQLSVFSNYNDQTNHTAGNLLEVNVFQEQTIGAGDAGAIYGFQFDAKKGMIAGSTTAIAFIKTFSAPGVLEDFVTIDTTSLPETWATYQVLLEIGAGTAGWTMQFGFANTATNNEPSSVYYDNVWFRELLPCEDNEVRSNDTLVGPDLIQGRETLTFGPDLSINNPGPGDEIIGNAPAVIFDGGPPGVSVGSIAQFGSFTSCLPPAPVVSTKVLKGTVTAPNELQPFLVNASQAIPLTDGETYTINFRAKATQEKSILVGLGKNEGDFANTAEPVPLTTEWQNFSLEQTAAGFGDPGLEGTRVLMDMNGFPGDACVDDVSVQVTAGGPELLTNGDFETGDKAPWTGDATAVIDDDANACAVVAAEPKVLRGFVGAPNELQPFLVNASQAIPLVDGSEYRINFRGKATEAKDIIVGIGKNEGDFLNVSQTIGLTTSWLPYSLDITAAGFGSPGGEGTRVLFDFNAFAGDGCIDDVTVQEKISETEFGPELLTNGDFETGSKDPWTGTDTSVVDEDGACDGGGGGPAEGEEIAINGGFEDSPDFTGWQQFPQTGTQSIVTGRESPQAARLFVDTVADNLIKNANLQAGNLTPNAPITVKFWMRGSAVSGGVAIVELISEFAGGGGTSEILYGPPDFPNAAWTEYVYNTTLGGDVSGGVTLQLKAGCGAVAGCEVDIEFDDISIVTEVTAP